MLKKEESKELQALSKALNTIGRKDASKKVASLLKVASFDLSQIKSWVRDQSRKVYKTHMNKDSKDTPTYSARRWFNFNGGQLGLKVKCFGNAGKIVTLYKLNEWWLEYSVSDQKTFDEDTKQVDSLDEAAKEDIKSLLTELAALDEEINGITSSPPGLSSAPASSAGEFTESGDSAVSSERAFRTQAEADAALAKLNASGKLQEGENSPDQPLLLEFISKRLIENKLYRVAGNTIFRFNSDGKCAFEDTRGKNGIVELPNSIKLFNRVFKFSFELNEYTTAELPFIINIEGVELGSDVEERNITASTDNARDSLFSSSSLRKRRLTKIAGDDSPFGIPSGAFEMFERPQEPKPESSPSRTRSTSRPKPYGKTQSLIKQVAQRNEIDLSSIEAWRLSDGQWGEGTSKAYNMVTGKSTTSTNPPTPSEAEKTLRALLEAPSEAPSQADAPMSDERKELLKKYWMVDLRTFNAMLAEGNPVTQQQFDLLFRERNALAKSNDPWRYLFQTRMSADTYTTIFDQKSTYGQKLNEVFSGLDENRRDYLELVLGRGSINQEQPTVNGYPVRNYDPDTFFYAEAEGESNDFVFQTWGDAVDGYNVWVTVNSLEGGKSPDLTTKIQPVEARQDQTTLTSSERTGLRANYRKIMKDGELDDQRRPDRYNVLSKRDRRVSRRRERLERRLQRNQDRLRSQR